jgi:tetratricopeptide (TPR) repeat protein
MIQKIKSAVQIAAIFCAIWGIGLPHAYAIQSTTNPADSSLVDSLNKRAFNSRLKNSKLSLVGAKQALALAKQLHYIKGEAEAYRMMGLASYYLFETEKSIGYYLKALQLFESTKNKVGQAKVLNNIGGLYSQTDYKKAMVYYNKALKIASPLRDTGILANIYLNMGTIHLRTKRHVEALDDYIKAEKMFSAVGDKTGVVHSLQNCGKIFLDRSMFDQAENFLVKAYKLAKEEGLSESIASINLSLASIYIAKKNYNTAEKYLKEGMEVSVVSWNGKPLEVELPNSVVLEITQTDPGVKGDTATGGTKPAIVETGAQVMVPLFLSIGEKIKIDTRNDSYLGRES